MARILIAVSSIGYGHVARSRALAKTLEDMGHVAELLAPPPTHEYVLAWGSRLHPLSRALEPLTPIVDKWYEKTGRGLIGLRMALEEQGIAKKNARLIEERLDFKEYDAVIADESWELLESPRFLKSTSPLKVYITDFLTYKPHTLSALPTAIAVNRYLARRLPLFDKVIHVGLEDPREDESRWMIIWGPRVSEWTREHMVEHTGPLPAVREQETLPRRQAREQLSRIIGTRLPPDKPWVLASLGGTTAGHRELSKLVEKLLTVPDWLTIVASPVEIIPRGKSIHHIPRSHRPILPRLLRAFNLALSPAGLTTLATHAALGLPTLAFPLPGHFEQENNVRLAPKKLGECIMPLNRYVEPESRVRELIGGVERGCRGLESIFLNLDSTARIVDRLI